MTLRLGIPSKGRLMDKTADWFAARGLAMRRTGSDRAYAAEIDGADVELRLLSAGKSRASLPPGASIWVSPAPTSCRSGSRAGTSWWSHWPPWASATPTS
jgi:hypothetical protein